VFVVDTNVLVYAANEDLPEHGRCRVALEDWRRQPSAWYTTWGVLYEFMRITTHPRVLRKPWRVSQAWGFVQALLGTPGLHVLVETDRHAAVAEQVLSELPQLSGNVLHDTHIAILMREHGIKWIYTRDTDFHRFPFLEVVDPLTV